VSSSPCLAAPTLGLSFLLLTFKGVVCGDVLETGVPLDLIDRLSLDGFCDWSSGVLTAGNVGSGFLGGGGLLVILAGWPSDLSLVKKMNAELFHMT